VAIRRQKEHPSAEQRADAKKISSATARRAIPGSGREVGSRRVGAYASLRSALSRLYGVVRESVEMNPSDLRLAASVSVDLRESQVLTHRLLEAVDQPLEATDL
jgi:hypothetical protein